MASTACLHDAFGRVPCPAIFLLEDKVCCNRCIFLGWLSEASATDDQETRREVLPPPPR